MLALFLLVFLLGRSGGSWDRLGALSSPDPLKCDVLISLFFGGDGIGFQEGVVCVYPLVPEVQSVGPASCEHLRIHCASTVDLRLQKTHR